MLVIISQAIGKYTSQFPGSFFAPKQSSNARFEARSLASPVALGGGTEAEAFQPYQGAPGKGWDLQTYGD